MKLHFTSRIVGVTLISLLPVCAYSAAPEGGTKASDKAVLSTNDLNKISERMRQTGEQMRLDVKKARARFEAQEVARKQAAERARQQAIKDNALRQAQKAAQARERQVAAQAQAERERQEAEKAKQLAAQTERKKQAMLTTQVTKEDQAAQIQARKEKAAEALRKARASVGVKAFGE